MRCYETSCQLIATLIGIISFGRLHGIYPSHGRHVGSIYALSSRKPLLSGIISPYVITEVRMREWRRTILDSIVSIYSNK